MFEQIEKRFSALLEQGERLERLAQDLAPREYYYITCAPPLMPPERAARLPTSHSAHPQEVIRTPTRPHCGRSSAGDWRLGSRRLG